MINGGASNFFKVSHEIRKCCPLTPFLFILVTETLNLLVKQAKNEHKIKGIKVPYEISLTHFLFVDDVLLFGWGSIEEWEAFKDILQLLCSSTIM